MLYAETGFKKREKNKPKFLLGQYQWKKQTVK